MEIQHRLVSQMIHIAVKKALEDMKTDTKRSIRNLLDLGLLFSRSENQKSFFSMAKQVVDYPENPYNALLSRMIADVDPETIKTFGVNLGYTCLIYGANKLKKQQAALNLKLPWLLVFNLPDTNFSDFIVHITSLIDEGRSLGINGIMFQSVGAESLPALCSIAKQFDECAFLLSISPDQITSETACRLQGIHNIAVCVEASDLDLNSTTYVNAFCNLRNNKCLYGIYTSCHDNSMDKVVSPEYIDTAILQGNVFCIYSANDTLSDANREQLYSFVCNERGAQGQGLICFDWYRDISTVSNKIFSDGGCLVIQSGEEKNCGYRNAKDLLNASLLDIIKKYQPCVKI